MRALPAVALAVVIGVGVPKSAHPGTDASSQTRVVDADFTLSAHWTDCAPAATLDEALHERPCRRGEMSAPHVVTGQHVPLPRAIDGSCPRRVSADVDGEASHPIPLEFEPAGCMANGGATCTHIIEHAIEIETSGAEFDADRCELVVGKSVARERVHRVVIRHATPREIGMPAWPPTP